MSTEMVKSRVSESHDDKIEFFESSFRLEILDPIKEGLSIIWRVSIAVGGKEHDKGSLVMKKLFGIDVSDIHDRGSKSNIFDIGLELVGKLLGHTRGSAVVNRKKASANDSLFAIRHWLLNWGFIEKKYL